MNRKSSMTMAPSAAACNIVNITWRLNSQTSDYSNRKKRHFHNASSALGENTNTQSQNSFNTFLANRNVKINNSILQLISPLKKINLFKFVQFKKILFGFKRKTL